MKLMLTILLVFILLDLVIVVYVLFRRFRRRLGIKAIQDIRQHWKRLIRGGDPRQAILEADKLLDHALHQMGYRGNLGNKLKKTAALFSNLNNLWSAHKIRNNIAHQIHYEIDDALYRRTMLAFKQAFRDLKIF